MLESTAISHIRYLSYLLPYLVIGQSYIGFLVIVVQAADIIGKHGKVINGHGLHECGWACTALFSHTESTDSTDIRPSQMAGISGSPEDEKFLRPSGSKRQSRAVQNLIQNYAKYLEPSQMAGM